MNVIISLLIAAWLTKAAVDVCVGILQILFGFTAALIGAGIMMLIFIFDVLAVLCRTASQKT